MIKNTHLYNIVFSRDDYMEVLMKLENHQDSILKTILNIDLSFIDYRAQSSNYFIINDVEYIGDNNYILYYKINYYIYNLCKDMDIDDDYETSINFTLNNGLLVFDIIDCERNISDEI